MANEDLAEVAHHAVLRRIAKRYLNPGDPVTEEGLAEELGYLPLALEHAGAYVETTGCTLAAYRRLLATQRVRLWERAEAPNAYHATITTTWETSTGT